MKNQVNTTEGNVQFIDATGKMINIHPQHVYAVFNVDTVSFVMVGIPKTSGLSILTSTAEDMLFNGEEYTFEELKTVIPEEFAEAGAQARCEIVDELPETGKTNTIYLVPKTEGEGYDEYIYLKDEERWELVGDTSIEMDNYLKKTDFAAYSAATDLKIDAISGAVSDEASRAISAESALSDSIDALEDYVDEVSGITDTLDGDIDILEESLAQEASARTAADEALSGAISSVTEDVAALSGDVTAHTSNTDIHVTAADKTAWADKYTQAEVDGIVSGLNDSIDVVSGAVADESARAQSAETALHDEIENIDLSDYYTKAEVDDMSEVAAQAINELTINKLDATAYTPTDLSNYYTKSETSGATELSTAFDAKLDVTAYTPTDLTNYYTKSQTSGATELSTAFAAKAELSALTEDERVWAEALTDLNGKIGTISGDVDTIEAVLPNKADTSAVTQAVADEATARTNADTALSGAVDTALLAYINGAEYVSTAKTINFLNGETVIDSIDATDFIKDGMVDNVVISGGSLVITFNTDSGKEAISIPLTDIFDPSNYYTKSQTSGATELSAAFSGITDRIGEDEEVTAAAFVALNDRVGSAETAINAKQNVLTAGENIVISGDVISAEAGNDVAELTQAEYDVLVQAGTVDPDVLYIITDAAPINLNNYYTSAQTVSAITEATSGKANSSDVYTKSETSGATELATAFSGITDRIGEDEEVTAAAFVALNDRIGSAETAISGKQDTLSAGTGIDITSNVISVTGGGSSVTVVQTTGTSTTDVMSQDAVTTSLNNKANKSAAVGSYSFGVTDSIPFIKLNKVDTAQSLNEIYYPNINGKGILTNNRTWAKNNLGFSLVETSAITTSVTSSSTDAQVPSAKAVNDKLGGLSIVQVTQAEYDALVSGGTVDASTLYVIVN